eukprot:TRINITY_DN21580_c0_g2_i1.p1 TRINITY_DN21580_c0_g2~~TRINITY_DN21580_c0_g2_i1.p1  ORF type:complete len:447 (+),score=188.65 TRINITY_DN21580_c0_g2_i1:88-1341(+)
MAKGKMPGKGKGSGSGRKFGGKSKKNVRGTMKRRIATDKASKPKEFVRATTKKLMPWEKSGAKQRKGAEKLPTQTDLEGRCEKKIPKSMRMFMSWVNSQKKAEEEAQAAAGQTEADTAAAAAAAAEQQAAKQQQQKKERRSKHLRGKTAAPAPVEYATPKAPAAITHSRTLADLVAEADAINSQGVLVPESLSTPAAAASAATASGAVGSMRGSYTTLQRSKKGAKAKGSAKAGGGAKRKREEEFDEDEELLTDDEAAVQTARDVTSDPKADAIEENAKANKTGIRDWAQIKSTRPVFGEQAQAPPSLTAPKEKRSLMPEHIKKKSLREMMERLAAGGPAEVHDKTITEAGARKTKETPDFLAMQQAARDQYSEFKKRQRQQQQSQLAAAQAKPMSRSARRAMHATDHTQEVKDFSY